MAEQIKEERLLELKSQIDEAKNEVNRLEGREEHLFQQLEEDWDCESLDEAKEVLNDLETEIEELETKIEEGIEELEEEYEFN